MGRGSKPGEHRGGREKGTPNRLPKGERALVKLDAAEREVRVLAAAGEDITKLGKDRLAELDAWAYGLARKFAPVEDEKPTVHMALPGNSRRLKTKNPR